MKFFKEIKNHKIVYIDTKNDVSSQEVREVMQFHKSFGQQNLKVTSKGDSVNIL